MSVTPTYHFGNPLLRKMVSINGYGFPVKGYGFPSQGNGFPLHGKFWQNLKNGFQPKN